MASRATSVHSPPAAASSAYAEFASFLRTSLAPKAPAKDAVGEERYRLGSRYFTGSRLDLAEACFRFLPARGRLDLLGYEEPDILSH